jgi:hypothetical protein
MYKKNVLRTLGLIIAFWAVLFQLPLCGAAQAGENQTPAAIVQPETEDLVSITGIPQIVVVSGSNYEMGYQYGQQAAPLIYQNKLLMNKMVESAVGKTTTWTDVKVWTYYLEKYDRKLKDWLNGIAAGCRSKKYNVTYADLVLNMVFPQELWARPQDPYPKVSRVIRKSPKIQSTAKAHNCSAFGVTGTATPDGNPIVTQSAITDVEQMGFLILVAYPTDGYPFVTFPHAGRVAGNHGMNSKGFAWTMDAAPALHSLWGVTSEVYFHYLNQYCASSAEAQNYLESTTRGGVTGLFIFADANPSKLYAFEANGQTAAARYPGDLGEKDFVIFSNDFHGPDMTPYNYPVDFMFNGGRYWTNFMHLTPLAEQSAIDIAAIKDIWKSPDWYDKDAESWHYNDPLNPNVPGNPFGVGGQTNNIFQPVSLTAYMQFGSPIGTGWPAYATGEYTKITLLENVPQVVDAAQSEALGTYQAALAQFLTTKMDPVLKDSLRNRLDQAMAAWSDALVDEAEAYFAGKKNDQMTYYGAALTGYSKAQLLSQMVTTQLNDILKGKTVKPR